MLVLLSFSIMYAVVGFADCNGNGIDDATEIAKGLVEDCQQNGIPDECELGGIEPIAYWRFETDSALILDSGPSALDGQSTDTSFSTVFGPREIPQTNAENGASRRISSTGFVTVDDPTGQLSMGENSISLEAWVRLNQLSDTSSASERQTLVQKKGLDAPGTSMDYMFLVQAGNAPITFDQTYGKPGDTVGGRELAAVFGDGDDSWCVTSNLKIRDLEWHHVSFSVDINDEQNTIRFAVDGVYEIIEFNPTPATNDGPLLIGAHTNVSGNYNQRLRGFVDELRVLSGVVDENLLLDSYAGGDCNGDLIPDGCQIASGLEVDCDGNGQPDVCQLAENDCDGNGVLDSCDPDCNGNGIPDACDISAGTSADCQEDGTPDECQISILGNIRYDVFGWGFLAFRTDVTQMVWLQRFDATEDNTLIEAIEVELGNAPEGQPIRACIWNDPNGDGNPEDAQLVWSIVDKFTNTTELKRIEVPGVGVGDRNASFFVGFSMEVSIDPFTGDFPASYDIFGDPDGSRSWLIGSDFPIDLNDLSSGAAEFGLIVETYDITGNWVIRVDTSAPGNDCNGNDIPDDCDILEGTSSDLDGDGIPDECGDCNQNGILDGFEILDGTATDCDGDGLLDECAVPSSDCDQNGVPDICQLEIMGDCDGNGILDTCDISSGYSTDEDDDGVPDRCQDCNGNGIIDSEDIDFGISEDCDSNGIPDECEYGQAIETMSYAYDDGAAESNLNIIGGIELAWMNRMTTTEGGEWISAVELAWGNTYPGLPAKVVVWADLDQDGDPSSGISVLTVFNTKSTNVLFSQFTTVPIPPTYVGPAGTSFFVGAYMDNSLYGTAPIAVDRSDPAGQSWFAATVDTVMDLNDLSATGFVYYWPHDNFLIRAVGHDGRFAGDCNENGDIDACDIINGSSLDTDGNGIPDECDSTCDGDLDNDGLVDGLDLTIMLGQWGELGGIADLNKDGFVDGGDLTQLLGRWGTCP
jgi:hypothetical protein